MPIYLTRGKYAAEVKYRGYGLTYHTILYMIYRMVSAQQTTFLCEMAEHFRKDTIFHSEADMPYTEPRRNMYFPMVVQSPYNIYIYIYIH